MVLNFLPYFLFPLRFALLSCPLPSSLLSSPLYSSLLSSQLSILPSSFPLLSSLPSSPLLLSSPLPPVLAFIKADVSKQCDTNQAAADKIKGQLKGFEAKLKDLEKTLKQAEDTVKTANTQNGLNAMSLKDLLVMAHIIVTIDDGDH